MRTGKLPEHTLKRSVLHPIRYRSDGIEPGPGIGYDGAVTGSMVTSMATTAFSYQGNEVYALHGAINNVIAAGGKPYGIGVAILLPEHSEEASLASITRNLYRKAEQYHLDILTGHTELVNTVTEPVVMVTAYGKKLWESRQDQVTPGMDLVMTKWCGLYGGAILAKLKREELVTRYPVSYIEKAASYLEQTDLFAELTVLESLIGSEKPTVYAAHDVSNGGVFGALWQLFSVCRCGGEVWLDRIPVKQEIIEVSEFFDINPYLMNGQGSLLLVTDKGRQLAEDFRSAGLEAEVIGVTKTGKDRKVILEEEERFLTPPKGDALHAVIYGQPMPV